MRSNQMGVFAFREYAKPKEIHGSIELDSITHQVFTGRQIRGDQLCICGGT